MPTYLKLDTNCRNYSHATYQNPCQRHSDQREKPLPQGTPSFYKYLKTRLLQRQHRIYFAIRKKNRTFAVRIWFVRSYFLPRMIKRESGGNPGQSRCCKLRQSRFQIPCHCPSRMGRPRNDGVSQKTCQFSFLKSFRGKSLKKDNTSMFDFFSRFFESCFELESQNSLCCRTVKQ